jgi:predicted PurR-regulated permease PerM
MNGLREERMGTTPENEGRKRIRQDYQHYFAMAVTIIVTFLVCILLFFIIYRYSGVARLWGKLMTIMQPFLIGFALAYILNPVMMFIEKCASRLLSKRLSPKSTRKMSRGLGIFGAIVVLLLVVFVLMELIIPQLINSISGVVSSLPSEIDAFVDWAKGLSEKNEQLAPVLQDVMMNGYDYFKGWVQDHFISQANMYIVSITSGVFGVVKVLLNIFVGIIISIYLLAGKERFIGQTKKLIYTLFDARRGNVIIATARKSNDIFGGFIGGKIVDSLIIGLLCYIGTTILNMPYAVLVSVVVGITNVIPFFGPYIGAIPSFVIIALANPIKGVYFLIFIIILQQLDGNVIGPKILGDSTGLSPFWVVFAILVAGGIFGFVGMLLGVPTFAVIYYIIQELISARLAKKKLPQDTDSYIKAQELDVESNELKY